MGDFLPIYRRHVKNLRLVGSGPEHAGECPFPKCKGKTDRKFYVNEVTGLFICHRCGMKGNAISFAKYFRENPGPFYDQPPNPTKIDQQKVTEYHRNLLDRPENWRRPWKRHILELLKLGWDEKWKVFTFPIFDSSGIINNLIYHKLSQTIGARCSLYPAHLLDGYDPSYVVLCEGLTDLVSLLSIDIQAVTSTGGATSIPRDITILHRFQRIYLCFDVDEAGDTGCDMWLNRLLSEMNS